MAPLLSESLERGMRRTTLPRQRKFTPPPLLACVGKVITYSIGSPTSTSSVAENNTPPALRFAVSPTLETGRKDFRTTSTGSLRSKRFDLRCSITGYSITVPFPPSGQDHLLAIRHSRNGTIVVGVPGLRLKPDSLWQ